jgi:1,4-alpha-glucan branching enzyme
MTPMRAWFRTLAVAALVVFSSGCAGGWRNGAPPGAPETSPATPTSTTTAYAEVPSRTTVTADGALFVWKGGGGSVSLAGEFNAWNASADPMARQPDGSWTLSKPLAPGRYAYKFVIDGTTWKEDPTATESVDDGFGGKNSVIVVAEGGAAPAATPAPAPAAAPAAGGGAVAGGDGVTFVWKGGGGSVALAGEFNAWNTTADPLAKQPDGTWRITKPLAPGRYAYKFVIDGTTWKEDPSAAETTDDGYGGKNSVIVVGGAAGTAAAPAGGGGAAAPVVTGKAQPPAITSDGVTFTFAGSATSVALAGEFNQWSVTADPLERRSDGTWTITKKLAPGTYGYKFIVNGTTWKQDEANPHGTDDGFGGKNSVVTVP